MDGQTSSLPVGDVSVTAPQNLATTILSDLIAFSKYAKHLPELRRRETYSESVNRTLNMHIKRFPFLEQDLRSAFSYTHRKEVLPSMRSMQFAGKPIELNEARGYNCGFFTMTDVHCFSELMFLLLSGCGVGYSVQHRHIKQLPEIMRPHGLRKFVVGDSIEGWADAVKVLVKAYFQGKPLPVFDFSDIRAEGTPLKTAGGKAPGPAPLRTCLSNIQSIFEAKQFGQQLTSLEVHDINCHIADAVLSGGIRRSAMIVIFDNDDEAMLRCKGTFEAAAVEGFTFNNNTYSGQVLHSGKLYMVYLNPEEMKDFSDTGLLPHYWFYPQRGRANNSAVMFRTDLNIDGETIPATTRERYDYVWNIARSMQSGEPAIYWSNHPDWGPNPCAEISLRNMQFCNLVEINAATATTENIFDRVEAAALIGTVQASYTNFHYLREEWKTNCELDALLGISLTGIADMGERYLQIDWEGAARRGLKVNAKYAALIGINATARGFCIKPAGTTSPLMGTSSGIHGRQGKYYLRRIRYNKHESLAQYLSITHPELIENEFQNPNNIVVTIPQRSPAGAILRTESSLALLERAKFFALHWVRPGWVSGANSHNVSLTVSVRDNEWESVINWMWDNKEYYHGISTFPYDSGHYRQMPFEECTEAVYLEMLSKLRKIDLSQVVEESNNVVFRDIVACSGNTCEIV